MRLDHLLSKEFLFWNGKEDRLEDSFYRCFGSVFFGKEETGFWLGMLSGFWSSAPDLTPPMRVATVCGCLFGVGVLVVNCIVDASIFDLCKQY